MTTDITAANSRNITTKQYALFNHPNSLHSPLEIKSRTLILLWNGNLRVLKGIRKAILIFLFFVLTFSFANIYGTFALLGLQVYGFTDLQNGYMYGIIGLTSAIGFSIFSVTLRWRKETPKFTTVAVAGLFCVLIALIFIAINIKLIGAGRDKDYLPHNISHWSTDDEIIVRTENQMRHIGKSLDGEMNEK